MPNLFERFDKKTPHYPNRFRDLIDRLSRKRAFDTSLGTEEEKFSQARFLPTNASIYSVSHHSDLLHRRRSAE